MNKTEAIVKYNDKFEEEYGMPLEAAIDLYEKDILKTPEVFWSDEFAEVWIGAMKKSWKDYEYTYIQLAEEMNKLNNQYSLGLPFVSAKDAEKTLKSSNEEHGGNTIFNEYTFRVAFFERTAEDLMKDAKESFEKCQKYGFDFKY